MHIKLANGRKADFEVGANIEEIGKVLAPEQMANALGGKIAGEYFGLHHPVREDAELAILSFEDKEGKAIFWHTSSHIMAQAIQHLYPKAKFAIGPAIEAGFYYDIDMEDTLNPDSFAAIEAEMKKIVAANIPLERFSLSRSEALELVKDQPYKVEMINDLPEEEKLTFYRQGDYTDFCAGPHLLSTGPVKAFKLTAVTGAYWRGDAKNRMLQRVYGISFPNEEMLTAHFEMLEEAKRRDHRKLGRELDLFDIFDEGPGFPFFFPNGMVLRNQLENFWREEHRKAGYQEIKTPIILRRELWENSGHWDHYRDNMYMTQIDNENFAVKPMNCPGGMLVFKRRPTSYKDLPIRAGELGLVHRHELSGALHGLMRVRNFTQDDAHLFMAEEHVQKEILDLIELEKKFYKLFGFEFAVELSTRPENSMGTDEQWEMATSMLQKALEASGLPYKINPGDGAFYGPKIDFHLKDSLGRTWQCGTIQLDMQMPERFELEYTGADGEKHRPIMLHRTIFGSIERFIGILTEHFAGAFPLWLCPVQAMVIPISDAHRDYAKKVEEELQKAGIRVEADYRNEKMNAKIRDAQLKKIPYMLVVGDKEAEAGTVSVRARNEARGGVKDIAACIADLEKEIADKDLF